MHREPAIGDIDVSVYRIPTETEEADGTYEWSHTTVVIVQISAADCVGLGYSYASGGAATVIRELLADVIKGESAMDVPHLWNALCAAVRNAGRPGICAMAISAVDSALWDLKARILGVPLCSLLGRVREEVPIYGSGGFTNFDMERLLKQLTGWVQSGIPRVKMKVGRDPKADVIRTAAVRESIGRDARLFVDANGAYPRKIALSQAEAFRIADVTWFEEPVTSDDLEGLRLIRDRAPGVIQVAAGEYGFDSTYFRRMLESGAVDVLQADATRCCGITGFLKAGALCQAYHIPLSAHCAPAQHLHPCCSADNLCHAEYFADHVRVEGMLFDGLAKPECGVLRPDMSRPGNGLVLKEKDAAQFACQL